MTSLVPSGRALPERQRSAPRSPDWMLDQLPVGMLGGEFFLRFVSIFQEVASSLLDDADNVDHVLNLAVAPDAMVRWMTTWIGGGTIDPALPHELQRRVARSAAQTLTWRGTAHGLRRLLELASGAPASVVDGGGVWRDGDAPTDPAWVTMTVASTGWMTEADFVALVRDEVPAHVRAELFVDSRIVWRSWEDAAR